MMKRYGIWIVKTRWLANYSRAGFLFSDCSSRISRSHKILDHKTLIDTYYSIGHRLGQGYLVPVQKHGTWCRRSPVRTLPYLYSRLRLHRWRPCARLVVWPGMLLPNSRGIKAAANLHLLATLTAHEPGQHILHMWPSLGPWSNSKCSETVEVRFWC